ncbi:hypothetical protein [Uliginosibacterium gangwonense]|uniref:hypothetical protein n=1 Tax=Uliginosibacterium gangwonense TaxID=392736 RepID=UPI00035EF69E|nr:hypothetical protein [Uliginosibacterium gangwonense]
MKYSNIVKTCVLTLSLVLSAWSAQADECVPYHATRASAFGKNDSGAYIQQQANNTWDDWVWRGPSFFCNSGGGGGGTCTYAWTQAKTTGYQWTVGISVDLKNIPVLGSGFKWLSYLAPFGVNGSYSQSRSYTETFGWTQVINQGYYAQPVQVIRRRWVSGNYRGMDVDTGRYCSTTIDSSGDGHMYRWDGNRSFGYWSGNIEVTRFGMYHIWK